MTADLDIISLAKLNAQEQRKLQETWVHIYRLCGIDDNTNDANKKSTVPDLTAELRGHLSEQTKSPEAFRERLWASILADHPDASVLRFLRARKWNVEQAMIMLVSALGWRGEHHIDDAVIFKGESVAHMPSGKTRSADEEAFLAQYRSGKSYVRGTDKEGRPVYVIRVRLHDPRLQTPEAMEAYVLHNIESIKTMLTFPNDKVCLLFDLTGFGLKNMDFHVVKFLVQVFEARYPETLGVVLIHKAPFVFWGIWSIIKGWLDPVIASKINFTSNTSHLLNFIEKSQLQRSYGGEDAWEYKYVEPLPEENGRMQDVEKRTKIQEERNDLARQFDTHTLAWVAAAAAAASGDETEDKTVREQADKRLELAQQLRANYWKLDPYIRARTYFHRAGVVGPGGEVDFRAAGA